jgi:hypothetical protein
MTDWEARARLLADVNHGYWLQLNRLDKSEREACVRVARLEDELATAHEALTTYKDYYGASVAQVRHLRECTECCPRNCSGDDGFHDRCTDYPTE